MAERTGLEPFFKPRSVAVVGASPDSRKPGYRILQNLVSSGYKGGVFPVNPHASSILGFRCYGSVREIPEPVDVFLLAVSAEAALVVAREIVRRKERYRDAFGVICLSAGFGELNTEESRSREEELVRTLRSASIRLMGPNCLGVLDAFGGFNTNFDIPAYPKGGLSLLTQSGAFATSFLFWSEGQGTAGISKFASIGNAADVGLAELLEYLKDDETTRVIGIYMEGSQDPRGFFRTAREVGAVKPVVVLKAGRSDIGSAAALSHTGAAAGRDAIYDGAFRQAGVLRTRSVLEFYGTLRALERQPLPGGNRAGVLTHMGGAGTICLDEISSGGALRLANLAPETRKALKAVSSPLANIGSPDGYVDLTAAHSERLHNRALSILFRDRNVDMILQLLGPSAFLDQELLVREIVDAFESQEGARKPLLNAVTFGPFAREIRRGLEGAGFPVFEHPDTLARVAGNMADYAEFRRRAQGPGTRGRAPPGGRVPGGETAGILESALARGRRNLIEPEAYGICGDYGIRYSPFRLAESLEEAACAARELGYPVVLKAADSRIVHKSAAGGVILGIYSDASFRDAGRRLLDNLSGTVPDPGKIRVLVQRMLPAPLELALGAVRDDAFGPVVMFGLGGVHVEALRLVGFRLAPLEVREAEDLVERTLPPALLDGPEGGSAVVRRSLAEALVSLGRVLEDHPRIREIDLNPVLPCRDGCAAVDARVILSGEG